MILEILGYFILIAGSLAAVVVIIASVLRCPHCGCWHDSTEADARCARKHSKP